MNFRKYQKQGISHTHHNKRSDFNIIKHTKKNWFFNPNKQYNYSDKTKATARLVRILTDHAPIGAFRERFNFKEPQKCHACNKNITKTRNYIVFECSDWAHISTTYIL